MIPALAIPTLAIPAIAPTSLAVTTRPTTSWLVVVVLAAAVAVVASRRNEVVSRPPRPIEIGESRPPSDARGGLEPPAVVGLLTNGYEVPVTAVPATVLDLARRRWIRLAVTDDGELVVFVRGSGRTGDVLRPFEQQVLNHLTARSFDGVTSASTLAASQSRLGRRWWRRFRRDVVRAARERNLTEPRHTPIRLAPVTVIVVAATLLTARALAVGETDVAVTDSVAPRAVWAAAAIAVAWAVVRTAKEWVTVAERPSEAGERRAGQWLGYRRRLVEGVPPDASVVTSPDQQLALAFATVMGVTPQVIDEIPIVDEDHRLAWSEAGGLPHVVRVVYPFRPGYGRNPWLLALVGLLVVVVSQMLQRFLHRVSDGDALTSIVGWVPEQSERVEHVVGVIADLVWIPTLWAVWAIAAGVIDSLLVRERVGTVVRVRRPIEVVPLRRVLAPLAQRDRFAVFVAVDDGRRRTVRSWMANERTAVPEGAQARVSATRLLGHVRASAPVGTSTRALER